MLAYLLTLKGPMLRCRPVVARTLAVLFVAAAWSPRRKDGKLAVLQCKRVKGSVGEPILRDLFGTMVASAAASAIVVTTGRVSDQARRWIQGKPIRIIELNELHDLLRKHFSEPDVVPPGFDPDQGLADSCPKCRRPLRLVRGRRGPFWGCSGYPACRYTQSKRFELRRSPTD